MKLKTFLILSLAAHVVVLGTVVLILFKGPPGLKKQVTDSRAFKATAAIYNDARPMLNLRNTQWCLNSLSSYPIEFELAEDKEEGKCKVVNSVEVKKVGRIRFSDPVVMTCSLAESMISWEKEVQEEALNIFNSPVSHLSHFGTYSCRENRSMPEVLSEHAYANAIDVSGFGLENGDFVSVLKDWNAPADDRKAKFLRNVAQKACDPFSLVKSPRSDKLHKDHFHLDNGVYQRCLG